MARVEVLTDAQWALIEPLMPSNVGRQGDPFAEHRRIFEGIVNKFRCGVPWRDLPEHFGCWQTVRKRHRRFSGDGTWDRILTTLLTHADAIGQIDWTVAVDSTIVRAHQHATTLARDTGGTVESHDRGLHLTAIPFN